MIVQVRITTAWRQTSWLFTSYNQTVELRTLSARVMIGFEVLRAFRLYVQYSNRLAMLSQLIKSFFLKKSYSVYSVFKLDTDSVFKMAKIIITSEIAEFSDS